MKRVFYVAFFLLFTSIYMTGCEAITKDEEEIEKDLTYNSEFLESINNQSITINSLTIEKRQTNTEDKTDYVYINVKGENWQLTYDLNYKLEYVLYNDGWILDSVETEAKEIRAISGMSDEECIAEYIEGRKYTDDEIPSIVVLGKEFNEEEQICYASIQEWEEEPTWSYISATTTDRLVRFRFNPDAVKWDYVDILESSWKRTWDLAGTWYLNSQTVSDKQKANEVLTIQEMDDCFHIDVIMSFYDYFGDYMGTYEYAGDVPKEMDAEEEYYFADNCFIEPYHDCVIVDIYDYNYYVHGRKSYKRRNE